MATVQVTKLPNMTIPLRRIVGNNTVQVHDLPLLHVRGIHRPDNVLARIYDTFKTDRVAIDSGADDDDNNLSVRSESDLSRAEGMPIDGSGDDDDSSASSLDISSADSDDDEDEERIAEEDNAPISASSAIPDATPKKHRRHRPLQHGGRALRVPADGFLYNFDCFSIFHRYENICVRLDDLLVAIGGTTHKVLTGSKSIRWHNRTTCTRAVEQFHLDGERMYIATRSQKVSTRKRNNSYVPKSYKYSHYVPIYMLPLFLASQDRAKRIRNSFFDIGRLLIDLMRSLLHSDLVSKDVATHAYAQLDANLSRVSVFVEEDREKTSNAHLTEETLNENRQRMEKALQVVERVEKTAKDAEKLQTLLENVQQQFDSNGANKDTAAQALILATQLKVECDKQTQMITALERKVQQQKSVLDRILKLEHQVHELRRADYHSSKTPKRGRPFKRKAPEPAPLSSATVEKDADPTTPQPPKKRSKHKH